MKRASRKPSNISESLHQRLNSYALAAGTGILALAPPLQARIVYTPANDSIRTESPIGIDLNHDGLIDFTFVASWGGCGSSQENWVSVQPVGKTNAMYGYGKKAVALPAGHRIGPSHHVKDHFDQSNRLMCGAWSNGHSGSWCGVRGDYVGLAFSIHKRTHYGWARLRVDPYGQTGRITGYAYETIPNKSIIAGKTHGKDVVTLQDASLGHLARGASAIPAWRGKEQ